jgi:heme exporter protein D
MRNLDFSSWQAMLSTLVGLAVITLIGVGIRLLVMQTLQQRRERENRQINERLRTLIAAYKTLGGSFTGALHVDPRHLRDLRQTAGAADDALAVPADIGSDRARRIRDAVEAALSDIVLLGTDAQVRLAAHAANELAEGRAVPTAELVVSLRDFIREALDLDPIPPSVAIPRQGPARPASGAKGKGAEAGDKGKGGGGGGGMGGMGGGAGGMGVGHARDDDSSHAR